MPVYQDDSMLEQSLDILEFDSTISIEKAAANFFEIRRLTGFSWTDLAKLLNVDRRTVFNWAAGNRVRKSNRVHIARTLDVLRYANRGSASENRRALQEFDSTGSTTPFKEIQAKNYRDAKRLAGRGIPHRVSNDSIDLARLATGEYQPIWRLFDADGTEQSEPLSYEPERKYQKWPHKIMS